MCSAAMVFLDSRSMVSLASELSMVMNSTQQSMRMSRASRVRVRGGGRISVAILVTVARKRGG